MPASPLHRLAALGQSVWVDDLSRAALRGGALAAQLERDAVTGVTSNPTIFQQALADGDAYADALRALAGADPCDAFWQLAVEDVQEACDLLHPVWERTTARDGYVSLEVDPALAHDADGTVRDALALHRRLARPNAMIKIPATEPGLDAIEACLAEGVPVNVTLIFSLRRYAEVVERFVRGLERLAAGGGAPSRVASVASFFVSRIDTETDRRLDASGAPELLRGQLAIANAKLAAAHARKAFAGARWQALAAAGARPQRLLWASTSTKNPRYPDTHYVEELIGPGTVNTMPQATIRAYQDHGDPAPRLEHGVAEAHRLLQDLAAAGVDYDDLTATLEREGVEKFAASFDALLSQIAAA